MLDTNDPCFVFAYALNGKGGAKSFTESDGAPTWVHLDYSHASAAKVMIEMGLDDYVIDALTRTDTRPRTVRFEDGELLLLRGINMNPGADPEDMVSLRMWVEPNRIITVRQRRLMAVQSIREELEAGRGPATIPDLIVAVVERLADRVAEYVDDLEAKLVEIEQVIDDQPDVSYRAQIAAIRRQTAVVRRYLAPQREALENFHRSAAALIGSDTAMVMRECADRFTRYVEDIDLVRERSLVLQEELLNLTVQEQSNRMYALSIVAAIFLPITFITGIFGMNVAGLPGIDYPDAFNLVAGTMVTVTAFIVILFKRKNWL
jgi:zinc transporter